MLGYVRRSYRIKQKAKMGRNYRASANLRKNASLAYKAYKIASTVAGKMNSEKKLWIANLGLTSVSNTGNIYPLFEPAQGVGLNNRVGNTCRLKSFQLKMEAQPALGTPTNERLRVILFVDKRRGWNATTNTDTTITPGDLLADTTNPIVSPWNNENYGRFRYLYDRILQVDVDDYPKRTVQIYKKLNHIVRFTIASQVNPTAGGIYLMVISEQATVASQPGILFYTQSRYYDN